MFWNRKFKVAPEETIVMESSPACGYCAQHFEERGLASFQAAQYLDKTPHGRAYTCREHHRMYCSGKSIRVLLAVPIHQVNSTSLP